MNNLDRLNANVEALIQQRRDLLEACKRALPHLKNLHSEDAYGSCSRAIEACGCDLSQDYNEIRAVIANADGTSSAA
jgi:multimeric flavodoxin WrbA